MSIRLAYSFNPEYQKRHTMKTILISDIGIYSRTNGNIGDTGNSGNQNSNNNESSSDAQNAGRKRNDPNKIDPTKQDEGDNDPTRIRPDVNEPDKNDPTGPPEPNKIPRPGSENDTNEQPKKTIGFLREE